MKKDLAFLIAALVASTITLVVTIAVNAATVANDTDNDYGTNFGWGMLMPMPSVAFFWTVIDLAVYRFGAYHCVYWLTTTCVLAAFGASMGAFGIAFYSWADDGAWVAGMFQVLLTIFYIVSMSQAAVAVHRWRRQQQSNRTRNKSSVASDTDLDELAPAKVEPKRRMIAKDL